MVNAVEVKSLSKTYQIDATVIPAVIDVSITVEAGEFVGLVGPSGSDFIWWLK